MAVGLVTLSFIVRVTPAQEVEVSQRETKGIWSNSKEMGHYGAWQREEEVKEGWMTKDEEREGADVERWVDRLTVDMSLLTVYCC